MDASDPIGNGFRLIGAFFILFGVVFAIVTMRAKKQAGRTLAWKTATGRILRSEIVHTSQDDADGRSHSTDAAIEYEYEVEGKTYRSGRRAFFQTGGTFAARDAVQRYPVGRHVMVYYDPDDPSSAVLEQDTPRSHLVMLVASIVFTLLGVLLVTR